MLNENNESVYIVRGHINIIILKALSEGDKYGYEIGKYIEAKSGGDYKLKQPTLYSSLKRLEVRKLISSYWGDENVTKGGRRKYFCLTEEGRKICSENLEDWNKSKKVIDKIILSNEYVKADKPERQKAADSPVVHNTYDNTASVLPQISRSQQLLNNDDKKDFEYKTILSKLLSNVKDDSVTKSDAAVNAKKENKETPEQISIEINNAEKEVKDFLIKDEYEKEAKNKEQYSSRINFEKDLKDDDLYLKEKSFSLLPSSSEYTFSGFNKMQYDLADQGFKLSTYNDVKKYGKQFLLINKINFLTALLLFLLIAAQTAFIYFYWEPLINIGLNYYVYIIAAFLSIPVITAICYAAKPDRRTKKRFLIRNSVISSFMMFIVAVLGVTSIALLFDINTASRYEIVLKIVIPLIYASNFVFYSIIWGILYKSKKFFM